MDSDQLDFLRGRVLLCLHLRHFDDVIEQINAQLDTRAPGDYVIHNCHRLRQSHSLGKPNTHNFIFVFGTNLKSPALATRIMRMTDQLALILPMDAHVMRCNVDFIDRDVVRMPGKVPLVRAVFNIMTPSASPPHHRSPSAYRSFLACGLWLLALTVKDIMDLVEAEG